MFTPPIVQDAENTSRAELNPCKVEMSGLDTWLVMVWVSAMFSPCSMKNMPRVIKNDGIPVLTTNHPLMNPIISNATGVAINPYVELTYSTDENEDAFRNGGATMKKKM